MTVAAEEDQVIETKIEDEVYAGEEGGGDEDGEGGVGTSVAGGKYVVPEGVAVEELKNYGGEIMIRFMMW